MKIDDALNGVPITRSRETRKTKAGTGSTSAGAGTSGDSVEITQASAQLSRLEEELGQLESADAGKVEAVRQAIAQGHFEVDEEVVAEALVKDTMEKLRRQGN
ncbi:flagellar biosynthesis anti-sigma factor FlgM [Parasulfuritortus cantonensis]|uniref:Negative regulator of flagellin synthesis n=1 Tax=Parasulfuritortus cantonensis TaxID=2528202 RepID=A0A4R1B6B6_9PROT|nr:flagellar biosynthesis anti-sigma factor FlgM [Parasulfuritortus cantonensis]TCJ13200.1 flagellar biosynthesis anti-sigma factor FlgM [Parasulfuritortus cantonensis]